jgi:hypothetical protein
MVMTHVAERCMSIPENLLHRAYKWESEGHSTLGCKFAESTRCQQSRLPRCTCAEISCSIIYSEMRLVMIEIVKDWAGQCVLNTR